MHFPIALLLTAAGLDVVGWALRCNRSLRFAATALYVIGTLAIVAAYFTGRAAAETIWLSGMAHGAVKEHWDWAFRAVWFFTILTAVRLVLLYRVRAEPRPRVAEKNKEDGTARLPARRRHGPRVGLLAQAPVSDVRKPSYRTDELTTLPPFMTNVTVSSAAMSASGSP